MVHFSSSKIVFFFFTFIDPIYSFFFPSGTSQFPFFLLPLCVVSRQKNEANPLNFSIQKRPALP